MKSLPENILVVGAYGLIGHGVTEKLVSDGHQVTGLGRDLRTASRVLPDIPWIRHDITALDGEAEWHEVLAGFSTVVNCSGALQDSPDNDLEALHHHAVAALAKACAAKDIALIQISAVGAKPDAATPFMASKGRGDAAIRAAGGTWRIFRPGLVLASNAYGGTTMLRMLSAFPLFQPIAAPEAKIQTVSLEDVASAVAAATTGRIPNGFEADLVETEAHTLREVIAQIRHWLGFRPARFEIVFPGFAVTAVSKLADVLSWFGWRSPLRSTAVSVLTDGIQGAPCDLQGFGAPQASSLDQTLRNTPVGAQDRLFARMALLAPVIFACLCLFWLASGVIGVVRVYEAAEVLQNVGWPAGLAIASVLIWAVVDIVIGIAFAFRKYAYAACWAAIGVSVFYLVASTIAVPALWLDPLGPLVKVAPSIVLALVARIALDTR